jgi:hypothetical protein
MTSPVSNRIVSFVIMSAHRAAFGALASLQALSGGHQINARVIKSGRSLGDRGECARCRNGDLMGKAAASKQKLPPARWLFRAKVLLPVTSFVATGLFLVVSGPLSAQTSAVSASQAILENHDRPMEVPFHCSEEDMEWAGLSCTEQDPCPAYFELAAAEPSGARIFAAGNIHSESVTLYSVLLGSEDGGKTWREVHERIRGAGLDHIQFADLINGWVSGEALSPLAQDPFLLSTTDGGATWRRQPVFDDTEAGSIQQFFFSSRKDGSLIVDRGEGSETERYSLHESTDGGETWRIVQLSKTPLRLPGGASGEKDWRVRADRVTQSFRIEHRVGERWTLAASFAVKAGACKPSAREPEPPEPQPEPAAPTQPKQPGR